MKDQVVIILSSKDDIHAQAVGKHVTEKHAKRVLILDTADYPGKWHLTMSIANGAKPKFIIRVDGQEYNEENLVGVWWRRPQQHLIPREVTEPKVREFCLNESRATFQGWAYSLGRKMVNPLATERPACHKVFQLIHATRIGIAIPRTLVTNAPADVPEFFKKNEGGTIFKILTGTEWQFSETREFQEDHLAHISTLQLAPIIFQEKISADLDIRATVIDDKIYAVSIRPNHPDAQIDWRLDMSAEIAPHTIPADVAFRLIQLNKSLGLRYGAMDLRLTPSGEYVFLEVNPGGQFLFAEIHGNQPISQALAEALVRSDDSTEFPLLHPDVHCVLS